MASDPFSQLQTAMNAAVAALGADDYATALQQALIAQALVGILPSLQRSAGSGGGSQSASWDASAIDKFIVRVRQAQNACVGVQVANKVYNPPASAGGLGFTQAY